MYSPTTKMIFASLILSENEHIKKHNYELIHVRWLTKINHLQTKFMNKILLEQTISTVKSGGKAFL